MALAGSDDLVTILSWKGEQDVPRVTPTARARCLTRENMSSYNLRPLSPCLKVITDWCLLMSQGLSVWTTETIPKGTRFGPLVGRHSNVDVTSLQLMTNLKHVWLVSDIYSSLQTMLLLYFSCCRKRTKHRQQMLLRLLHYKWLRYPLV